MCSLHGSVEGSRVAREPHARFMCSSARTDRSITLILAKARLSPITDRNDTLPLSYICGILMVSHFSI